MTLREQIVEDMKNAMRAHDAPRLSAIRMLLAAVKQREVDDKADPTDEMIHGVIGKLVKQRRDSVAQYLKGGRQDLADKESFEIEVLSAYLPRQMTDDEIRKVVAEAVAAAGATDMSAMGRVMGIVKGKTAGRADMGRVSALVRAALTAG